MTIMSNEPIGQSKIPISALLLGLGGLIPFVALPVWQILAVDDLMRERALAAFIFYAASILSFLGGIGWGVAMGERDPLHRGLAFGVSVVPALVAWAAAFVNVQYLGFSLGMLSIAFALQGAWDVHLSKSGRAPRWFASLRLGLTLVVLLALTVMWLWRPALSGSAGLSL